MAEEWREGGMADEQPNAENPSPDLKNIYRGELNNLKGSQWQIAYYAMAIIGGLLVYITSIDHKPPVNDIERLLVSQVGIIVVIVNYWFQNDLHKKLTYFRSQLRPDAKHLEYNYGHPSYSINIKRMFCWSAIVAYVFMIWFVWRDRILN
jgi:hypothetical protein